MSLLNSKKHNSFKDRDLLVFSECREESQANDDTNSFLTSTDYSYCTYDVAVSLDY